jgi:hypothetical protein
MQIVKDSRFDWFWYLRDLRTSRTLFNRRGCKDRKECENQAITAYLIYFAVVLIAGTNDSRELFIDVHS